MIPPWMAAVGLGLSAAAIAAALTKSDKDRQKGRAVDVVRRWRKGLVPTLKRQAPASGLDQVARRLLPRPAKLMERLTQAGMQPSVGRYLTMILIAAAALGVALVFFGTPLWAAPPAAVLLAAFILRWWVSRAIRRRKDKFLLGFPEAIGLIVRGLKSGLPISESLTVVAREVAGPVGEEFSRAADAIGLGAPLEDAIADCARRIRLREFDFFVVLLGIQRETGGNLAESLGNLDEILRQRRQMKLRIKAASSEARSSAMIIGSMPFLIAILLFLVSPKYLLPLWTTGFGRVLLGVAVSSMTFGFFVISRLIKIEV